MLRRWSSCGCFLIGGQVGIDLEDSLAPRRPVARRATDVDPFGIGAAAGRFEDVVAHAAAYADAGAINGALPPR
ncbi:MAG TPA: hypothetical protein VFX16_32080 [Pseudonocardiaceae bacterium]|nr:hypothetical protein [Pseudonocardiaceae bacterium]